MQAVLGSTVDRDPRRFAQVGSGDLIIRAYPLKSTNPSKSSTVAVAISPVCTALVVAGYRWRTFNCLYSSTILPPQWVDRYPFSAHLSTCPIPFLRALSVDVAGVVLVSE